MNRFSYYFLLSLLVFASCKTISYDYTLQVVKVADGDTFTGLNKKNEQVKVRIYALDAPEKNQPYGTVSKDYLSELIFGQKVMIKDMGTDRYGRVLGIVYTADKRDVTEAMIAAGLAWHYKSYDKSNRYVLYENLEEEARLKKTGLWSDPSPIAPWEWRAQKRRK